MAKKKTPKRLTKRQRKELIGKGTSGNPEHVHCVACGAHLHAEQFTGRPSTARWLKCLHGSRYGSCESCVDETKRRLAEHDRTGNPVQVTTAWH